MQEALRAAAPDLHAQVPDSAWREGWWVHFQPAGSGENVVKYLARYVGRTAISDERILEADDDAVRFPYTDTASGERRECTLNAEEFMRRYLQHVLPPGQHRVRYFGWLHPAAKRSARSSRPCWPSSSIVRPKPGPARPGICAARIARSSRWSGSPRSPARPHEPADGNARPAPIPSCRSSPGKSASRCFARRRLGRSFRASSLAQRGSRHRAPGHHRCLRSLNTRAPRPKPVRSPRPVPPPREIQNA